LKLLIDTHFVSWLAFRPHKLDRRELALIKRSELLVSVVSIQELRIKWVKFERTRHRRDDLLDPAEALTYIARNEIPLMPLTGEICATILDMPLLHDDPFDEQLLIHAQYLGVKLLTRDSKLIDHPLAIAA
jgi:PIN domain nuclease of toxin-antitoxin system